MTTDTPASREQQAREMLAAEFHAAGYRRSAEMLREGQTNSITEPALRAMLALADAPRPESASGEAVRYAAIGETSTEGARWYIWRSGEGRNYVGGKIADKQSAENIAAELNRLAAPRPTQVAETREAKVIAAAVLQSACETDPADPEHPNTIMITCEDLESLVRMHVELADERAALPPIAEDRDDG
jgi:hypothetical protein